MNTFFTEERVASVTAGSWLLPVKLQLSAPSLQDDTRKIKSGDIFIAIPGELTDGYNYIENAANAGAAIVISQREPSCAMRETLAKLGCGYLLVNSAMDAFQALASAYRSQFAALKVIGITGSCGKTSTKEMCAVVMNALYPEAVIKTEGNTNNFFGVPRNLLRLNEKTKAAVIETGSNHPGEIAKLASIVKPDMAVITCIGAAHLEYFRDLNGVAEEKGDILQALPQNGTCIIPYACAGKEILLQHASGRKVITFGLDDGADVQAIYGGIRAIGESFGYALTLKRRETGESVELIWNIGGQEQAANAAAAAALGIANGLSLAQIAQALPNCRLPGSRQAVSEINGVHWVNDAYNANPNSMAAGLRWFEELSRGKKRLIVIGDMGELGETSLEQHKSMLELAQSLFPNDKLITIGKQFAKCAGKIENFTSVETASLSPEKGSWVYLKGSQATGLFKLVPKP